jgi:hypothetical protein
MHTQPTVRKRRPTASNRRARSGGAMPRVTGTITSARKSIPPTQTSALKTWM